MRTLGLLVLAFLIAVSAVLFDAACYDANSPNLPPCGKGGTWPDPCASAARDAGSDG